MESLTTHPSTALQATAFTSPASLSYPGGTGDLTPPSEKDGHTQANGILNHVNGSSQPNGVNAVNGNGVAPATPAATPSAGQGVSGIVPTLQNIVATVNLDCRLDLKTIALHARNAEYNPKRFAAVIMRIREPKTTALIFASGKMVVTGAKSEDDSKLASRKYARIIQKLGFNAKFTDFKIQNIVGSCDIKFPIRLEGLASRHHNFSSYEPELFPGLIYRMIKPKIVLLIFVSGKIVLTGAKVREEIYQAFEMIYPVLSVSTCLSLLCSPHHTRTHIILLDPSLPTTVSSHHHWIPNPNTASIDTSRIIRPDYKNSIYAALGSEAQKKWREGYASQGGKVYWESGLCVTANDMENRYLQEAMNNVESAEDGYKEVQGLQNSEEIRAAMRLGAKGKGPDEVGQTGYVNWGSGWADAEGAMKDVMRQVRELGSKSNRLEFRRGKAKRLLCEQRPPPSTNEGQSNVVGTYVERKPKPRVNGALLEDGMRVIADLTILATGAWTASLLNLRDRAVATGQLLAYVPITASEAQRFSSLPVLLNLSSGYFLLPPSNSYILPTDTEKRWHLKLARHAYGYQNPVPVSRQDVLFGESVSLSSIKANIVSETRGRERGGEEEESVLASLPDDSDFKTLPPQATASLRAFLASLVPGLASRPFASTRLCWYTDTPRGDFIVDFHPDCEGLFVATGGSGHAFKFLPVLGEKILNILDGKQKEDAGLRDCWAWPKEEQREGWWGTEDGSRGGEKRLLLGVERRRGGSRL
ncbi:MAG: hypothetical protein LQ351_003116 [Letrouitia transgressa]|nr:MAG: hypothetical protein LQ351_003116 [Letrouitia transgressa]